MHCIQMGVLSEYVKMLNEVYLTLKHLGRTNLHFFFSRAI